MSATLILVLLIVLAVANLWLGQRAAKATKTEDDFYLGGRSLGLLPLALTILATQIGGGTMLGAAEEAYQKGWVVIFYPLGTCLGLMLVALGFGAKVREMQLTTVSELFEKVFNCTILRQVSSVYSIVSLFIILVAQGIAAQKFFGAIGFDQPWCFLAFWMILVTYTVMGGLRAVVNTDILQVLFIFVAFALAFFTADIRLDTDQLVQGAPSFDRTDVPWIGWLLMPLLFMFIEQDMGQRFFAAKSPRLVTIGAVVAAVTMLLCTSVPIYFGVQAANLGLEIPAGKSVLLSAIEMTTTPVVSSIVTVGILMAIISTADTLLCSISSNVSYDFPAMRHKNVIWAKGITLVIGMLSLAASYAFSNVVSVLIFSYELSVSALFVPVVLGALGKGARKEQAYGAVIMGTLAFLILRVYPVMIPREILTLILSFAGFYAPCLMPGMKRVEPRVV